MVEDLQKGQPSTQAAKTGWRSWIAWISSILSGAFLDDFSVFASVAGFLLFAFSMRLYPASIFPYSWFPSMLAVYGFKVAFSAWVLAEIINAILSRRNSKAKSQDKNSYWAVSVATWTAVISTFLVRQTGIGIFGGDMQYLGIGIALLGVLVHEWAIFSLGRQFSVRVQIQDKATIVTKGPYRFIRHASYTGSLLTFVGFPLAIGTWLGAAFVLLVCVAAYNYRIRVEEEAMEKEFGPEYEEYRKKTWKLFPGY